MRTGATRVQREASSDGFGPLCCDAVDDRAETPPDEAIHHDVAADDTLAEGGMLPVEIDGREIAVCRVAGVLHAVSLRCTHAAWAMRDQPLDGFELVCSLHGARFDVRDGSPTAGPARGPLDRWPVRVRDGRIEVALPRRRAPERGRARRAPVASRPDDA